MQEQNEQITGDRPSHLSILLSISKWARFISIVGFSMGAFVVMTMLVSGKEVLNGVASAMNLQMEGLYGALIVGFFIVFFIAAAILYFLFKAAQLLKQGAEENNEILIAEGFSFLKRFFLVMAILGTIGLFSNVMKMFL